MNKELVKHFVREMKEEQEWYERYKRNHIEFDNYFKYSGRVEESKALITQWNYNKNHNCNDLHEQYIKVHRYKQPKIY